ncbi:hypothetical protein N0824_01069 [Microcystis sp. 0824]|nr:hypothetical protein N0824_01069 [Microcystis sp. 0824]
MNQPYYEPNLGTGGINTPLIKGGLRGDQHPLIKGGLRGDQRNADSRQDE